MCGSVCLPECVRDWTRESGRCAFPLSHTKQSLFSFFFHSFDMTAAWQILKTAAFLFNPPSSFFLLRLSCQCKLKGGHLTAFVFSVFFTRWCVDIKKNICIPQSNPHDCFCCQTMVNNYKPLLTCPYSSTVYGDMHMHMLIVYPFLISLKGCHTHGCLLFATFTTGWQP